MTPKNGNYDGADKALDTLLAQNICLCAYEKAKTVTEIASDLGVAADYIEETLEKLTKTQCVKQISNKYQTNNKRTTTYNDYFNMMRKNRNTNIKTIINNVFNNNFIKIYFSPY